MKALVQMPQSIISNRNNWRCKETTFYRSHHCYHGTSMEAFETTDTCSNCDGARCEGCKEVPIPAAWRLSCPSDDLYDALIQEKLDEGVAADLAYNDFGCKTHTLNWDCEIPEDVLKQLTTPDENFFKWLDENYDPEKMRLTNCMAYAEYAGLKYNENDTYLNAQIDLYFKMKKNKA